MRYVLKYGGSSVATLEQIENIAKYLKKWYIKGDSLVVVVSAMGKTTNEIIKLSEKVNKMPNGRELDNLLACGEIQSSSLLALALQNIGIKSVAFTGFQAGIITNSKHTKASIVSINVNRILQKLNNRYIVIVAGFQGIDNNGDITTIGRGGSDTTAVALASCLKCPCEIYTDVEGVATMDPKIMQRAKKIKNINIETMLDTALNGAKVLDSRCLQVAKKYKTSLYLGKSLEISRNGTNILSNSNIDFENMPVTSIAKLDNINLVKLRCKISNINEVVKTLSQNNGEIIFYSKNKNNVEFVFKINTMNELNLIIETLSKQMRLECLQILENVCKLTIIIPNNQYLTEIQQTALIKLIEKGIYFEKVVANGNNFAIYLYENDKINAMQILGECFNLLEEENE